MKVLNNLVYPDEDEIHALETCFGERFPAERDVASVRIWIESNVARMRNQSKGQHFLANICEKMLNQIPKSTLT